MKKKLALFDLDGTLFNTDDVNYWSYRDAMADFSISLNYDYFINNCNGRHYKEFLPPLIGDDISMLEEIHIKKMRLYPGYLYKAKENQHLFQIIKYIRESYNTGIVTTASQTNCWQILKYFEYSDLFDLVVTREDVQHSKPSPEGFLKAMRYFGVAGQDTIIFEDSDAGLKAAQKTGAIVFVVKHF